MRIAFFTDTYHPTIDGVVRAVDLFKLQLEKKGHEVKVFAPSPSAGIGKMEGVCYAPSIEFPSYPQYRIPYGTRECIGKAVAFKPDIVHCHAMAAMALAAKAAAKKSRAPLVGTFHTLLPKAGHYISGSEGVQLWFEDICWRYLRWLYKDFDLVLSPSAFMQKHIRKYGIESQVLPSPVDVKMFCPGKVEGEVAKWAKKGQVPVLFFGRVAKEKNIEFLLEMAQEGRWKEANLRLIIAGDGPQKKALEKMAAKKGLGESIVFAGRVEQRLVPSYYRMAKCSIFPSTFETQGLAALESLACGTPVVALKRTALEEVVIPKKSGALCEQDAQNAISAVLEVLAQEKKLSAGSREVAMEYSVEKCGNELEKIYKKLVLEKKHKGQKNK